MPLNLDPLFKNRNFEEYSEGVNIDTAEISKLYGNELPIYFHTQNPAEVNAELRQFVESKVFSLFTTQLEKCFAKINAFAVDNAIKVETRIPELIGINGIQGVEVGAEVLLNRFLNHLKTDHFADRRAILYAEGKQYLEKLSILLFLSDINREDRIIQLRTMVDDDVLELCADGCFSRLQTTVENLKAKLDFSVDGLMREFIKNQLDAVLQKPQLSGQTPTQKLASILNQNLENNEIHFYNWLKEKLKEELQLPIESSNDMYVRIIDRLLEKWDENIKDQVNITYEKIKKDFLIRLTGSEFVKFVVSYIYPDLNSMSEYMELVGKVENTLKVFGEDESFSLEEIIDADTGKLKSLQAFFKTIVLRLLESDFFDKKQVVLDSSDQYQFKIFKKNLLLLLIKQTNAEESFSNLFEFIKQPQQLTQIFESIAAGKKNNFLSELIQTPEDFVFFLNNIDLLTPHSFTNSLLEIFANLKIDYDLYFPSLPIDDSKIPLFIPTFETIYSMLCHLNSGIGQPGSAKDFFYKKIIHAAEFNKIFSAYLAASTSTALIPELIESEIKTVLEKLLFMGMKDFSGILFSNDADLQYLSGFNFSECDFSNSVFLVSLVACDLPEAKLNNIKILVEPAFSNVNLIRANIVNAVIEGDVYSSFFSMAKISDTTFFEINNSYFNEARLIRVKFDKVYNTEFLKAQISATTFTGETKRPNFIEAVVTESEFISLVRPNFTKANLKSVSIEKLCGGKFKDAILEDVNFDEIFTKEGIIEEILAEFDVNFSSADLKKVSFNSIKLNGNKLDFSQAKLKDITFKALDLTKASEVNFIDTKFEAVIFDDIKFKNVGFIGNEFTDVTFRNCDLSQVIFDFKDNYSAQIKLEGVKLNPYQLITFYAAGIRDFSIIQLKDVASEQGVEFSSHYTLSGVKLSEQAFEYLASHGFRNFQNTDLQLISHETLAKYVAQSDYQFENANFPEGFDFYNSACSGTRKKRGLSEFCLQLRKKMADDSNTRLIQEKVIDSMRFLQAQHEWQQKVAPILKGLKGNWLPRLMTAKSLANGNEALSFINLDTQEERVYELSGKTSLALLERLQWAYQSTFSNSLDEKIQFLESLAKNTGLDPSTFIESEVSSGDVVETEVGDGSFMLFVGLSTKSIIDLIKNNGCPKGAVIAETECYLNAVFLAQTFISAGLSVGSLAWQKTFFPSFTKVFNRLALPLMFTQEGLDIYKLATAKREEEIATAATALTFNTATLGLTGVAAFGSAIAGLLVVPLMGLSSGIEDLVGNYQALLSKEKAVGQFLNQINKDYEQGGFKKVQQGLSHMQALPTTVIEEINFKAKTVKLKGPMLYRSTEDSINSCPAADPNTENAFNVGATLGYAQIIQLTHPEVEVLIWILPGTPQYFIFYRYRQAPGIALRHDAEFDTLRELASKEKFYADKYCFPTHYAVADLLFSYIKSIIRVVLDGEDRVLVIPKAERAGYIRYIIDAHTLDTRCTLYLNAQGGSVTLQGGGKQFQWIFNAQALTGDAVHFNENSIRIAGVNITLDHPQQTHYVLVTRDGHTFILDRQQQRKIISVINYTPLQSDKQTIQSFITSQAHVPETVGIIDYKDGYTGVAFYLTREDSIVFTKDIPQDVAQGAVLISANKSSALFYNAHRSQLWRTNRHNHLLEANYVFPGEIISVSQTETGLQIVVQHRTERYQLVYRLADSDTQAVLQQVIGGFVWDLIDMVYRIKRRVKLSTNEEADLKRCMKDFTDHISKTDEIYKNREWPTSSRLDQWIRIRVSTVSSEVWLKVTNDDYKIICPLFLGFNFLGPVFGTASAGKQTYAYVVGEEDSKTQGIYLQTTDKDARLISFVNWPPEHLKFPVKNAFRKEGNLILLMSDDILYELDATGDTQVVSFTAAWTQNYAAWWREISHYLVDKTVKKGGEFINVKGINDRQAEPLTVLYDPHAKCYVLIKANVMNHSLSYHGKVVVGTDYYYYFYLAEEGVIYQYQGIAIENMQDLFKSQKLQKEASVLEKIAVYQSYRPPAIPTLELVELSNSAPQVQVSTSHLWLQTPQGLSLVFDPSTQSWQLQHIDYEKWFGQLALAPFSQFSELVYRVNHLKTDLQLKALTENEMLLIAKNHKIIFWLTENNQAVVPPVPKDIHNWFYLGKCSDSKTNLFFSTSDKKLYFLDSTVIRNNYDYDDDIDAIEPHFKRTMKVNFAGKPNEHSVVLGLNPNEVAVNTIPKLEGIESLGLVLNSDLSFTVSLANRTTSFYPTLIYQVSNKKVTSTLELSGDDGPWMAKKIKNTTNEGVNREILVVFNKDQQLIFPLNSENNISIQVSRGDGAEKQTYRKSLQAINKRAEQSIEPIFIFNAWKVANGLSVNNALEAKAGRYQQETLGVNVAATQLSEADSEPSRVGFWPVWLGGGFVCLGFLGGLGGWLLRRRVGHAGYNGATVVSLGAGSTVVEFNRAHAHAVEPMLPSDGERIEQEDVDVLAMDEKLQSANIPEITEGDLEYFAGGLWKNTLPLAGLLSKKFSEQREKRYWGVDFARRARISQLEERQVKLEVEQLADRLLLPWESEQKAEIVVKDIPSLVEQLWKPPYKAYLPRGMMWSELSEKMTACFEYSNQATFANLRSFLRELFVEKVSKKVKASCFSPIKELSDKQKTAFVKIMSVISQTEEAFVDSLQLSAKPANESTKGLCGFIQSSFNFFKSISGFSTKDEQRVSNKP